MFFRLLDHPPVRAEHFYTYEQLGRPLPNERLRDMWARGVSVYDDWDAAVAKAWIIKNPICCFVVRVVIPETCSLVITQTTKDQAHYTIWDADPGELMGYVSGEPIRVREV